MPPIYPSRLLCVADELPLRIELGEALREAGYTVAIAGRGEEALQHLHHDRFDLVLCTALLPDMAGVELLRRARAAGSLSADMPWLLVLSSDASGGASDDPQAHAGLAADCLHLPLDHQQLLTMVASRLQAMARMRERMREELVDSLSLPGSARPSPTLPGRAQLIDAITAAEFGTQLLLVAGDGLIQLSRHSERTVVDQARQQLLARLRESFPEAIGLPHELATDVYALVLPPGIDADDEWQRRLQPVADLPLQLDAQRLRLRSTLVVASLDSATGNPQHARRSVDAVMLELDSGVRSKPGSVSLIDPAKLKQLRVACSVEAALPGAIARGEMRLVYEPKLRVQDHQVIGAEALLRWTSPELGSVSPGFFIPIAERLGLIEGLSSWVLDQALLASEQLRLRGLPLIIAVNASGAELSPQFAPRVADLLARRRTPAHLLEVEITETALIADPGAASRAIHLLRGLGVHVSIDDFGTGHASLQYLRQFPVNGLKIDRMFVQGMVNNPVDHAIVENVVSLCRSLNISVVAEGIETEQQLALVQALGCDCVQGYLFTRSLSFDDLLVFVQQRAPTTRGNVALASG